MTLDARTDRLLRDFAASLRRDDLSDTAVTHYVGTVRRGLEAGDLLDLIRGAKSRGSAFIARSAVTRWAKWRKDKALEAQIVGVPFLPHSPAVKTRIGPEVRRKILSSAMGQHEPIRSFLALVVMSGLRVGDLFSATRRSLGRLASSPEMSDLHVAAAAAVLLGTPGWRTLGGLLSPAGYSAAYAVLRRALRKACAGAGVPYVAPEEFRRLAAAEAATKEKSCG